MLGVKMCTGKRAKFEYVATSVISTLSMAQAWLMDHPVSFNMFNS